MNGYPSPDTHKMDAVIEFTAVGEVSLINNQLSSEEVLYLKGHRDYYANYRKWTDIAILLINRELKQRGLMVVANTRKTLKVAVKDAETEVGWIQVKTRIVMQVETGSGYTKEFIGRNHAGEAAIIPRQTDGALMRAVAAMLNDAEVIRYLTE